MKSGTIVVNCIGLGHWGPNLVRAFTRIPGVKVRAVCDLDESRLRLVQTNIPGIEIFTTCPDFACMDEAATAIAIATPVSTHYDLAKKALLAGKHVFIEKPLAATVPEAAALCQIAQENNRILANGHIFLFNNGIRAVRNIIRSGELGVVRYFAATRTNLGPVRIDTSPLWDLACHDVSIFNWCLGRTPVAASAIGAAFLNPPIPDVVFATFFYENNVIAHVHASWLNPRKCRELLVVGDRKMLVWNDLSPDEPVRIYEKSIDVVRAPVYSDSYGSFMMQTRTGDIVSPHVAASEPLAVECEHFIQCIRNQQQPLNNGWEAIEVMRALEAAEKSLKEAGRVVPIAPRLGNIEEYHGHAAVVEHSSCSGKKM